MKKIISIGKNFYGWLPITFHSNNEKNNVTASGSEVYNPFVEIQYIINNINNSKYSRWEINQESSIIIIEFKPSKKIEKMFLLKYIILMTKLFLIQELYLKNH